MKFTWGLALALTSFQIIFALLLSPSSLAPTSTERSGYRSLCQWDCFHYKVIATEGYLRPSGEITPEDVHNKKANAVFFPGFPLLARGVLAVLPISVETILIGVAQICAFIFWLYLILWMGQIGLNREMSIWVLLAIGIFPSTFFVVAGYTEAPFLAFAMGYFYWSERWVKTKSVLHGALVFLHGAFCGGIRIVAFALAPYPFFRSLHMSPVSKGARTGKLSSYIIALFLGGSVTVGAILFFTFLHFKFGEWNLYFKLEEIGWGNHRRWFALLDPRSYVPRFFFEQTVDSLNRLSVPTLMVLFCGLAFQYWKQIADASSQGIKRLKKIITSSWFAPFFTAFVLFYIPVTGKAAANMDSMVRYSLPPFVLLAVLIGKYCQDHRITKLGRYKSAVWFLGIFSAAVQVWFLYRFLRGAWIA